MAIRDYVTIPADSMLTPGGEDGLGLGHTSERSKRLSTGPQRDSTRSHQFHHSFQVAPQTVLHEKHEKKTIELILYLIYQAP